MIQRLSAQTSEELQSSLLLISIEDIVQVLLSNSISACQSNGTIWLSIDFASWTLSLKDDGLGLAVEDVALNGSLGAVSYMGVVELTSGSSHLVLKDGRVLSIIEGVTGRGTTVTVRSIFHKLPVRRSTSSPRIQLSSLTRAIHASILLHPHISLKLLADSKVILDLPKVESTKRRFADIYGHELRRISYSPTNILVTGFVSLEPGRRRREQNIYFNGERCAEDEVYDAAGEETCLIIIEAEEELSVEQMRKAVRRALSGEAPKKRKRIEEPIAVARPRTVAAATELHGNPPQGMMAWHDPLVNQTYWIDKRTGISIDPLGSKRQRIDRSHLTRRPNTAPQPGSLSMTIQHGQPPAWLSETLSRWRNPVFASVVEEDMIPRLKADDKLEASITRESLAQARVVGQADDKYIMCVLKNEVLVCIDQHAADERCRVERMVQEFTEACMSGEVTKNQVPDGVVVPARDVGELDGLRFWGFECEIAEQGVRVTAVPEILEGRMFTPGGRFINAELLCELIESNVDLASPPTESWMSTSLYLPAELRNQLVSLSCRSAIMFNDPLSPAQLDELLDRLSRCHFPFQCAHGRPSMIPLCRLA